MTIKVHWIKLTCVMLVAALLLAACGGSGEESKQGGESQAKYSGKKIVWIDSYHQGYEWSDGIEQGIQSVLKDTGVELKIIRLDTKNNPDEAFGEQAGQAAKAEIDEFKPDVIIASDDNAQKYVIVPFFKDTDMPVVFCGLNWDASIYGFPTSNITGMIEVEAPQQVIEYLKPYAKGERVGHVAIDTETERKVVEAYNTLFFDEQLEVAWAKTYDEFTAAFLDLQNKVDIVLVGNNAGADRWDEAEAKQFFVENTRVPTGAMYEWLAPYALITLAKLAPEQGEWAAQAALQILDGTSPADIAVVQNQRGDLYANLDIAAALDVALPPDILRNAIIIGGDTGESAG